MTPKCNICFYYCRDIFEITGKAYDYSHSFCGLHGCAEIIDPWSYPPDLMHKENDQYNCRCGFFPKINEPIQLSLF